MAKHRRPAPGAGRNSGSPRQAGAIPAASIPVPADDDVFIPSRRVVATPLAKDGAAEKSGAADDDVFVPRNGVTAKLGAASATRAAIHARMVALEADVLAAIGDDVVRRPGESIEHDAGRAPDDARDVCAYGCGGVGSDHKYDCAWWGNEGVDETPF